MDALSTDAAECKPVNNQPPGPGHSDHHGERYNAMQMAFDVCVCVSMGGVARGGAR